MRSCFLLGLRACVGLRSRRASTAETEGAGMHRPGGLACIPSLGAAFAWTASPDLCLPPPFVDGTARRATRCTRRRCARAQLRCLPPRLTCRSLRRRFTTSSWQTLRSPSPSFSGRPSSTWCRAAEQTGSQMTRHEEGRALASKTTYRLRMHVQYKTSRRAPLKLSRRQSLPPPPPHSTPQPALCAPAAPTRGLFF